MTRIPDHPEIRCAERTGYPSWMADEYDGLRCCQCGCRISEYDRFAVIDWAAERILCADCMNEKEEDDDA